MMKVFILNFKALSSNLFLHEVILANSSQHTERLEKKVYSKKYEINSKDVVNKKPINFHNYYDSRELRRQYIS